MVEGVDPKGEKFDKQVLGKEVFAENGVPPLEGVRVFTVNHLFANVWSGCEDSVGHVVNLRERRHVTIALLAAQGHSEQLKTHVEGAHLAGLIDRELIGIMIHVAHYAG